MIGRLEVLPGQGTAARFAEVAIWAGPNASSELVAFLVQSARNLGSAPDGGQQIADHLAGVLNDRRPEPATPFATVGPGTRSPVALLHGPVQLWDGARWVRPDAARGWLMIEVPDLSTVLVTPNETQAPASPNSLLDLQAGVVRGGGLAVLLTPGPPMPAPQPPVPVPQPPEPTAPEPAAPEPAAPPAPEPTPPEPTPPEPAAPEPVAPEPAAPEPTPPEPAAPGPGPARPPEEPATAMGQETAGAAAPETAAGTEAPRAGPPLGTIDLRAVSAPSGAALAHAGQGGEAPPGSVVVQGIRCPSAHFNHPGARTCLRCGLPLDARRGSSTGPRPALGVLVATDGKLWRVDASYLVGTAPSDDPAVAGGQARPLVVADDGQTGTIHAELRATDWTLTVVDRHTSAGTFVLPSGGQDWQRVPPDQAVPVHAGTHVAVGSTVLTFTSPWPV